MFCAKLPVEESGQNADLNDYNHYEDNFVGENIQIHFPEYSSAPPKLHISFHQPEKINNDLILGALSPHLFLVLSRVSL